MSESNKMAYIIFVALMLIGFNVGIVFHLKAGTTILIPLALLFVLLCAIIFRNWALSLRPNWLPIAGASITGVVLTLLSHAWAFTYAGLGMVLMSSIQLRIMLRSGVYALVGGKPHENINRSEAGSAAWGLSMMLSVLLAFLCEFLYLRLSSI